MSDYAFQNARVPACHLTFEAEILGRRRKCEIITDLRCQISRSFLPSSVRIPCQIGRGHEEYPYRFSRPKSPLLLLRLLLFIHPPSKLLVSAKRDRKLHSVAESEGKKSCRMLPILSVTQIHPLRLKCTSTIGTVMNDAPSGLSTPNSK